MLTRERSSMLTRDKKSFNIVTAMCWCVCVCVCLPVCSVVKEEIVDDAAHLPCFNGRVVCWVRFSGCACELLVAYYVLYLILLNDYCIVSDT